MTLSETVAVVVASLSLGVFLGAWIASYTPSPKASIAETPDTDPRDDDLGAEGGHGFIRPSAEGPKSCEVEGCDDRAIARLVVPAIPPEGDDGFRCRACLEYDLDSWGWG